MFETSPDEQFPPVTKTFFIKSSISYESCKYDPLFIFTKFWEKSKFIIKNELNKSENFNSK